MTEREAKQSVADVARMLHARGWVANHDGNVTTRTAPGRLLATATAVSKRLVSPGDVLVLDGTGEKVGGGPGRTFGELGLHLAVYAQRGDVAAVVHAHPPHATALACAGSDVLERPFVAEAVVSIGPVVPTVPFAVPGPAAAQALGPVSRRFDVVLLGSHGVIAWGADLEQAFLRLELVEHLARIALLATAVGGVRPLADDVVEALLAKRRRAGLGEAADGTPPWPWNGLTSADGDAAGDLRDVIRQELLATLGR